MRVAAPHEPVCRRAGGRWKNKNRRACSCVTFFLSSLPISPFLYLFIFCSGVPTTSCLTPSVFLNSIFFNFFIFRRGNDRKRTSASSLTAASCLTPSTNQGTLAWTCTRRRAAVSTTAKCGPTFFVASLQVIFSLFLFLFYFFGRFHNCEMRPASSAASLSVLSPPFFKFVGGYVYVF